MKKKEGILYVLLIIVIALALTACANNGKVVKPEEPKGDSAEDNNVDLEDHKNIIKDFRVIAEDLPDPDVLIEFIEENIEKLGKEDVDEMINTLERSLEKHQPIYEERIVEMDKGYELIAIDGGEKEFRESSIDKIKDEKLKKEMKNLYANKYKLINIEGGFYPFIDYHALKAYSKYSSNEWKDYIHIRSLESDDLSMLDGGLTISFDELADRIFKTEEYLKNYPKAKRKKEMLDQYEIKINAYLSGLPNTSIENYETKEIRREVLESYKKTAEKEYEISIIVEEYLEIIEKNNTIIDNALLLESKKLTEKALENFE